MKDADIRNSFHKKVLRREHASKQTRVVDELGLMHGACRADVAVVNGRLIGYEIKSDSDSLRRLRTQIQAYNAIFDHVTIIVGEKHRPRIKHAVPKWWGIMFSTKAERGGIRFHVDRRSRTNPKVNMVSIARLLWRNEAVEILRTMGASASVLRSPRVKLYRHLARHLSANELKRVVRTYLKCRANWRYQSQPSPSDGSFQPIAMSSGLPG